ncbi:hypothetical protein PTTG_02680 [Puccinia triticina 1-1 BBBD Race 1]|uniref:Uncharacterized protein n=1 Tax=Puccinia triticina (isolate 1-1 / race 1 (BBBD)) TaxID=630390 RepID=A0A180G900_PUCT1|nr:hypothetical protein PTTG_02680 [Puccinia triticina 1-1 BBBD Race 1]
MVGARQGGRGTGVAIPPITDIVVSVLQEYSPRHALMSRAEVAASINVSLVVRMAYLWLHMYMQRQQDRTTTLVRSPWEQINRHLEAMRRKSWDYKSAELFDGTKTAKDLAGIAVSLPSEEEVEEILVRRAQEAPEDKDKGVVADTF